MDAPTIDGLNIAQTIGVGVCGSVYAAEKAPGQPVAVKVFQGMSINRALWQKMTARLEIGGWPRGVMPVISADFDARPAVLVTADYRDDEGKPGNLQHLWGQDPSLVVWDVIRELAQALSHMHNRQVAHGNLKPSNIFFGESGELLLSDWTLGHMPGISHLDYTDAFLYQSPEQLLHPEGYLEEAGYRWDVFAFACLSFRLLTGMFPRCHETFSKVAPPFGESRRESIVADTQKIALGLASDHLAPWPTEAANAREQEYRDLLLQCLHLEAHLRPANMADVSRRFEEIDFRHDAEEHRDQLLDQRRRSRHLASLLTVISGLLLAGLVLVTANWWRTKHLLGQEKSSRLTEVSALKNTTEQALDQKTMAEKLRNTEVAAAVDLQKKAEQTLINERTQWIEKIRASRDVGDHLFHWALNKGHRDLPPLDGRETRLQSLDSYYQQFIRKSALLPELSEERSRAQLQLAEIALAQGDAAKASARFEAVLPLIKKHEHDADWQLRIATDELLLALLWQRGGDARCADGFIAARQSIAALPKSGVDLDRIKQLQAILEYHEAKILAENGNSTQALEQLMRASTQLNALADVRPEVTILRSELAQCYLSSAEILEGMGQMGDARETRVLAVNELVSLLKNKPKDFNLRLELASTYAAMADSSMLAGDVTSADQLSCNAIKLLEQLLREQPENHLVTTRLASQRIIVASLLEDRGEVAKARDVVENGIKLLESSVTTEKASPLAIFHYARLLWEKGRITGVSGDRKRGIALYQQAMECFLQLGKQDQGDLRAEQIHRHIGYLHSDIGHACQLEKNTEQAKRSFAASLAIWQELLQQQPKHPEYRELLQWCQSRLKEL